MKRENCTDIDNEVKTNIDNEVRIHPAFIRFVLNRPWLRNANSYKDIRSYEKKQRMKWLFENDKDSLYCNRLQIIFKNIKIVWNLEINK